MQKVLPNYLLLLFLTYYYLFVCKNISELPANIINIIHVFVLIKDLHDHPYTLIENF